MSVSDPPLNRETMKYCSNRYRLSVKIIQVLKGFSEWWIFRGFVLISSQGQDQEATQYPFPAI